MAIYLYLELSILMFFMLFVCICQTLNKEFTYLLTYMILSRIRGPSRKIVKIILHYITNMLWKRLAMVKDFVIEQSILGATQRKLWKGMLNFV